LEGNAEYLFMENISSEKAASVTEEVNANSRVIVWLQKLADILLAIEPTWVLSVLTYSYMLTASIVPGPSYLVWLGLAVACIPFVLRKLRWGYFSIRSAFEIPAAIFLAGAIVGLIVSINFDLSIRTFQSLLVCVLAYYSFVNCRHPRTLLVVFCILFSAFWIVVPSLAFLKSITLSSTTGPVSWIGNIVERMPQILRLSIEGDSIINSGAVYNIAFPIMLLVTVLLGVVIFCHKWWLRASSLILGAILLVTLFAITDEGLYRLFSGTTFETRIDLWKDTIHMIKQNPLTGLGLGMPLLFTYGTFETRFTHPHNSYLELYANTGILGAIAVVISLIIVIKIAIDIIKSDASNQWYCLGIGLIFALLASAGFGLVLTSSSGYLFAHNDGYYYGVSIVPWILGAGLVMIRRTLREQKNQN